MQTIIPLAVQVMVVLLNQGTISAEFINSIPYTLSACLFMSILGTFKTTCKLNKKKYLIASLNSMLAQGGVLLQAGGIVTNGVYTNIGMNMSNMATFSNGFSAHYYPMRVNQDNALECKIVTKRNEDIILLASTDYYFIKENAIYTCDHTIFRGEVQRNMNALNEFPFGNIRLFRVGKLTVNMTAYDDTMNKYLHAIGALTTTEGPKKYTINQKEWMKKLSSEIEYTHDETNWVEPTTTGFWFVLMLSWPSNKVVSFITNLIPSTLEAIFAIAGLV